MVCGINDQVIDTIKEITENRDLKHTICVVAFYTTTLPTTTSTTRPICKILSPFEIYIIGIAKWSHIEELYKIEKHNLNFVFAPTLTEKNLQPNGEQKMKVCLTAQVLSHSIASRLYAKAAQNELPHGAVGTATVVLNMDKLTA